jgi:hypothetical protein
MRLIPLCNQAQTYFAPPEDAYPDYPSHQADSFAQPNPPQFEMNQGGSQFQQHHQPMGGPQQLQVGYPGYNQQQPCELGVSRQRSIPETHGRMLNLCISVGYGYAQAGPLTNAGPIAATPIEQSDYE